MREFSSFLECYALSFDKYSRQFGKPQCLHLQGKPVQETRNEFTLLLQTKRNLNQVENLTHESSFVIKDAIILSLSTDQIDFNYIK
jgi:hypothetical protein